MLKYFDQMNFPLAKNLLSLFRAHAESLLAVQDPTTGLWPNILTNPSDPFQETSSSSMFMTGQSFSSPIGLAFSYFLCF